MSDDITESDETGEIVPIEVRLPSGVWYTLSQPGWAEAEDESGPLLAAGGRLVAFRSPLELAHWVASSQGHELTLAEAWPDVLSWPGTAFTPDEEDRHDLTLGTVLADRVVGRDEIEDLAADAQLLDDLVTALDLEGDAVEELEGSEEYTNLLEHPEQFEWMIAGLQRDRLLALLQSAWPAVVGAIDERVLTPAVGDALPGADDEAADARGLAAPLEELSAAETLWIGLAEGGVFTIRALPDPDEDPLYLGADGVLVGATALPVLRAWLSAGEDHDLTELDGWDDVAGSDEVDLEPYEDAVIDLAEAGRGIGAGLTADDAARVTAAWLLVADLAQWGRWNEVEDALAADRPVGRFLTAALPELSAGDPRGAMRLADLGEEEVRADWERLVGLVTARIRVVG